MAFLGVHSPNPLPKASGLGNLTSLNAHTLCAKLGLNAQSLGDSMILGKAQSSTYFYCGLLRDLTVGILRYGGLSVGGLSLATCSVLHTARLLHAQGIGVGGRASVYGESQGSGNGSIYLAAASFSRVFTFYILIQLAHPLGSQVQVQVRHLLSNISLCAWQNLASHAN